MSDVLTRTHYDVLAVAPDATPEQIRFAYRQLARVVHPDRHTGSPLAETQALRAAMAEVNEAWAVLSDPARRDEYDRSLGLEPRRPTSIKSTSIKSASIKSTLRRPFDASSADQPRRLLALLAAGAVLGLLGLLQRPVHPNGTPASHHGDVTTTTTTAPPAPSTTATAPPSTAAPQPTPSAPAPVTAAPAPSTTTTSTTSPTALTLVPPVLCPALQDREPRLADLCPPDGG